MAALAPILLEDLAEAALVALRGATVTGGAVAAGAAIKQKVDQASDAKASPIAKTDAGTKKPCQKCPPDTGAVMKRKVDTSKEWVRYQARICLSVLGPDFIEEWKWLTKEFDGFKSAECMLEEAKGDYDQFLDEDGEPVYRFQNGIFLDIVEQARARSIIVNANPPAQLTYYFETPMTYNRVRDLLLRMRIIVLYVP